MPTWPVPDPDKAELGFLMVTHGLKPVLKLEHLKTGGAKAVTARVRRAGLAVMSLMEPGGKQSLLIGPHTDPIKELLALTRESDAGYASPVLKERMGALLGYPPCCAKAFSTYRVLDESRQFVARPYWKSVGRMHGELNLLAKESLIFHQPCHYGCEPSLRLAMQVLSLYPDAQRRLFSLSRGMFFHHHNRYAIFEKEKDLSTAIFEGYWPDREEWQSLGVLNRGQGHWKGFWEGRPPIYCPFGQESMVKKALSIGFLVPPQEFRPLWKAGGSVPHLSADLMVMGLNVKVIRPGPETEPDLWVESFLTEGVNLVLSPGVLPELWADKLESRGIQLLPYSTDQKGKVPGVLTAPPHLLRPTVLRAVDAIAHGEMGEQWESAAFGLEDGFHFHCGDNIRHDRAEILGQQIEGEIAQLGYTPPALSGQVNWVLKRNEIPPRFALWGRHLMRVERVSRAILKELPKDKSAKIFMGGTPRHFLAAKEKIQNALAFSAEQDGRIVFQVDQFLLLHVHHKALSYLGGRRNSKNWEEILGLFKRWEALADSKLFNWKTGIPNSVIFFSPETNLEQLAMLGKFLNDQNFWPLITKPDLLTTGEPLDMKAGLVKRICENFNQRTSLEMKTIFFRAIQFANQQGKTVDIEEALRRFSKTVGL